MQEYSTKYGSQFGKHGQLRLWSGAAVGAATLLVPALAAATQGYLRSSSDISLQEDHFGQIELNGRANLNCNGHAIFPSPTFPIVGNCQDETGATRSCMIRVNATPKVNSDDYIEIRDCQIHGQGRFDYGLSVADSWRFKIIGVDADNAKRAGVHIRDSDNFLVYQSVYSDSFRGVELIRAGGSVVEVVATRNSDSGIYQYDSDSNEYHRDHLIDNGGPGLFVDRGTSLWIQDLVASGCWAGVQIANSRWFTLETGHFTGNQYGIRILASGDGLIWGNYAHGNSVYDAWQSKNTISATNDWHIENDFGTRRNVTLR